MSEAFINSERALLSSVIQGSKETQEWVVSEISYKDFGRLQHQRAFRAVASILDEGLEVNRVSVRDRARLSSSDLEEMLGYKLCNPSELKTFIKDIKNASRTRYLESVLSESKQLLSQPDIDPQAVIESLESKLYGNGAAGLGIKESLDARDVANSVVKTLQERISGNGDPEISTGLKALDKAILGLRQGKNIVIGARPGMGKSALAGSLAYNTERQGYGVIVFSAEMLEDEMMERGLAAYADVNSRKISSGKNVTPEELAALQAAPAMIKAGYWKLNTSANTLAQIRRVARLEKARMARQGIRLALIVVDYLQLYTGPEESAISDGSRHCKLMAQELGCTVLTLSQLNRGVEHREDKRPMLSDLRGSGTIEQDADIVLFLYRPGYYPGSETGPEETECIIAKQRGGPSGTVRIRFIERQARFIDYEPISQGPNGSPDVAGHCEGQDGDMQKNGPEAETDSVQHREPGLSRTPDSSSAA